MSEDFKYDVFLSHSSKDLAVVREVAERLRNDGLRVWLDDWRLKPGDHLMTSPATCPCLQFLIYTVALARWPGTHLEKTGEPFQRH